MSRSVQTPRGLSPSLLLPMRPLAALCVVTATLAFGTSLSHAEEVIVHARSCIDVDVNGQRSLSFDCLNAKLRDTALNAPPPTHVFDVYDAVGGGAPNQVGTFSLTATAIQMGNTFGHSAFPQRPPQPVYSNPIVGAR